MTPGTREGTQSAAVRIVVAEPPDAGHAIAAALARLGREVRVEVVHELAALRQCLPGADLLILDQALGPRALGWLDSLTDARPPAIFVVREPGEEAAVEAFRCGAADCVSAAGDLDHALAVAALEQIRRFRAARERGDALRRVRSLERLNEAIVEAMPAALAVLDPDRVILTVNPAFARLAGETPDALRGRAVDGVLPEGGLGGGVGDALAEAEGGGPRAPRLVRAGEGERRAFEVRVQPLEEGRRLLLLSEVTEVEDLLRQVGDLRRYTENIIQNMNSALLVVDAEGLVSYANPTAEAVLGAPPGGLAGQSIADWFPDRPREEELLWRTLAEGARFRGAETVARRPDGRRVPIGVSCAPLTDDNGRREGAVAIFQDLTEIKQLQRQVLQTEKMASIGQLAAGVAHEINNPMGFIHANLYQMAEYLDDLARVWEKVSALRKAVAESPEAGPRARAAERELAETVEELEADFLLDDIGKAARESIEGSERIRAIVQDLRAFSHQDTAERTLTDVNKALDSTANIVWTMMKHSVLLTKQYDELPPIRCYPMQLKQVFMNLLVNAYQAVEERYANGAQDGRGEIRLRTRLRGDGVAIEVADNGTGIAPDVQARIFDPFFTTKGVGEGTGLGLSTSYTLVKRHGGALTVESRAGEGTAFEVWLPLSEDVGEPGS